MDITRRRTAAAIGLILIFLVQSVIQIAHFGIGQGTYFWFCNIALLLSGTALYFERKDALLVILSVLLPTQTVWILDYSARALTGVDLFGLTEALYNPSVSTFLFFMGQYHYFLIPVLFYFFFQMPPLQKIPLFKSLLVLGVFILPTSLLYPFDQNVNCAHISCLESLPTLDGWKYYLTYATFMLLICFATGILVKRVIEPLSLSSQVIPKTLNRWLFVLLLVALGLTAMGYSRKRKIPRFSCRDAYEDKIVKIKCDFLSEHVPNWMVLHYQLQNKTPLTQECASFIEFEGKKELFQEGLTVEPDTPLKVSILIHYPTKDTAIQLTAECKPL